MNREAFIDDMKNFLDEQKWAQILGDQSQDLNFFAPGNPWTFIHEKQQLNRGQKGKTELNRQQAIFEIGYFLLTTTITSASQLQGQILELLVDKHQIPKVKKADLLKITQIAIMDLQKETREGIIKFLTDRMEDNIILERGVILLVKIKQLREICQILELVQRQQQQLTYENVHMILKEIAQEPLILPERVDEITHRAMKGSAHQGIFSFKLFAEILL